MQEYDLIAKYFAPLTAETPEALELKDDAALVQVRQDSCWTVTTDTLVEGVHFLGSEPAGDIARKLLRVNLSDLAGMGARPRYYMLGLALPRRVGENWVAAFAKGLAQDQAVYAVQLLGGDTTATHGPAVLSLTAWGDYPDSAPPLLRSTAQPGDVICVSGTIGDALLGLACARRQLALADPAEATFLRQRYVLPEPRLQLARQLSSLAHAGTDISDGLAADLQRLCTASGVGAEINGADIPLSRAARNALEQHSTTLDMLISGGDDYEVLLTLPAARLPEAGQYATACGVPLTPIGHITKGSAIRWRDVSGDELRLKHAGYQHFA